MGTPPKTADQLRSSFTDFFAAKGHTVVPSASLIPHDPTVLFTVAGMVPFKPYFVGDEVAPFTRAVTSAEVRPCRWQAQRPRRRRPHQAPPRVLRDARQLQLRRLLQERRHPVELGARHRGARASTATVCGSPSTRATTKPRPSGTSRSACRWTASSASATRTTSGRWATPARAARAARSTSTAVRRSAPMAARSTTRTATGSWSSGTSSSCSTTRRPTAAARRCRSRQHRHRCRSRAHPLPAAGRRLRVGDRPHAAAHRAGVQPHRQDLRRPATTTTATASPCASSPSTPAAAPCSSATACSPATRAAATCCAASSAARSATPTCSAPRSSSCRRSPRPRSTSWATPTPTCVKNRDFVVNVLAREEERFRQTLKTGLTILEDELVDQTRAVSPAAPRSCCTTRTASRSSSPRRSPASAA